MVIYPQGGSYVTTKATKICDTVQHMLLQGIHNTALILCRRTHDMQCDGEAVKVS